MSVSAFQAEWSALHQHTHPETSRFTSELVNEHAAALSDAFYEHMLKDNHAKQFLSHEQVKNRLRHSLRKWLCDLCAVDGSERSEAIYAHQVKIGEVHARIDLPVSLVLKGARVLKARYDRILEHTPQTEPRQRLNSMRLFSSLMDMAMEVMSQAYTTSSERKARSSEAYRLFSVTENLATEKEKQKAALLDWESKLMYEAVMGTSADRLPKIRESDFGLWFRHKGMHAFQGVAQTHIISDAMNGIDEVCLPLLAARAIHSEERGDVIREIRAHAKNIQYQMEDLFSKSLEVESGKDVLTRLLNRKFLPSVLGREIQFSRDQEKTFAVASIDIDYFKNINDTHGHEVGDLIIQQVAALLNNQCRAGDFLFRMGGEEFLIVLVDIDRSRAMQFCERIRTSVAEQRFLLPNDRSLSVTVSIGLAVYNGHPDYNYLLREADQALYKAKEGGRNRVCAEPD